MIGFIEKIFIVFLASVLSTSNHTKCVSLSNQKCEIPPTLINLHPNEYSQELHCYLFAVKLDRRIGNCNTLNDFSNKECAPDKTEDLNLIINHANVNINLTVEVVIQIKSRITINGNANAKSKKIIFGILLYVVAKMVNI